MTRPLRLNVNGVVRDVYAEPGETLLSCLRERLGLFGTKEGCGDGECGACMVLLDGSPVNSCLTLAGDAEGHEITTIEGLSVDGRMSPLQEAFVAKGAVQCGFCTPGLLITATALLHRNPDPTEAEIREAIAGNLCRCTGYAKVVEAIQAAAHGEKLGPEGGELGTNMARLDAAEKATGTAQYGADVSRPGQLWGAVVRSTRPHARVVAVDPTEALRLPGVATVVTGSELPPDLYYGVDLYDQQVLARDKVRYVGEPVALVAAETPERAAEAADLVRVEYEELPAVHDMNSALAPLAPLVHERLLEYEADWPVIREGNVCSASYIERGDVAAALAACDRVFTHTFETQIIHQSYIEPHASLAEADGNGKVTIWTNNQKPFAVRRYISHALGWPMTRIRVIGMQIGGGFGGKLELGLEPYAALLALKARRPVKMVMSRREEFQAASPRHASRITVTTGVTRDMKIVARRAQLLFDTGAYSGNGPTAVGLAMFLVTGPYRIPNVDLVGKTVYTNKASSGSCRGPGGPQAVFAGESQIDIIAREMGWDPLEFRLANLVEDGDVLGAGQRLEDVGVRECLEKAAAAIGYHREKAPDEGVGLACSWWTSGGWATSALLNLNEDGTVTVITGAVDIGPGAKYTSVPQLVAAELNLRPQDVIISGCDTDTSPYDHGDGGSRMTYSVGRVCQMAAAELRARILERASHILGVSEDQLELAPGAVRFRGDEESALTLAEIAEHGRTLSDGPVQGRSSYLADMPVWDTDSCRGMVYPSFIAPSFSAQAARVWVDRETGAIRVREVAAAMDVGKAINPQAVEGQLEGGVAMGLGYGLMEEVKMRDGVVINPNFLDYKILTAPDMPPVRTVIVEQPSATGLHGVKGAGEPPASMPAAAVANAVDDAVGVRCHRLPMTAEAVLRLLDEESAG
jgi:CO/xanthine dehydrogenase Mo-binding subunit/aerobic-type carbon monoxide dehydrogenase small subunit (CoxS/CutS family)